MNYILAHAGEAHADAPITVTERNNADMLLPVIIITLVSMVALAAMSTLLSRKKKIQPKTAEQDETE